MLNIQNMFCMVLDLSGISPGTAKTRNDREIVLMHLNSKDSKA